MLKPSDPRNGATRNGDDDHSLTGPANRLSEMVGNNKRQTVRVGASGMDFKYRRSRVTDAREGREFEGLTGLFFGFGRSPSPSPSLEGDIDAEVGVGLLPEESDRTGV